MSPLVDLVALHLRLDDVVVDQQTLAAGYDQACAAGEPFACRWRAWDEWGRARTADLARLADGACAQGHGVACEVLGLALLASDRAAAAGRLRAACDAGSGRACTELGRIVAAGYGNEPADPAAARTLHERGCAQGSATACARAGRAAPLDPAAGCAAGALAACDAWLATASGADRITALERLCTGDRARCPELAAARAAGDPGVLRSDRPVARATWAEGGVLLGWDAPTFLGHRWVSLDALDHVELHVGLARQEHFVLHPAEGDPIPLPDEGCAAVLAGVAALDAGGRLARAIDPSGAPTTSACVESATGRRPAYRSGKLEVVPRSTEHVGQATALLKRLAAASDPMWRCAEAVDRGGRVAPWAAEVVHAKAGPPTKLTTVQSSGDPTYDACLAAWLGATDLGPSPYKVVHTVRVDLDW